ncbi:hypothetical protein [Leptospira idonii]|uniref:Uncharacterized protein n=1 Tax=Leptospira idonii TaxID=1193500 RepID=A0A4R9M2M4_9LEPT|nr:hypothetical protein [Leptospira idonii]TGN21023.1 hypothetical protein EHS15_00440 [Leptospira idonii]
MFFPIKSNLCNGILYISILSLIFCYSGNSPDYCDVGGRIIHDKSCNKQKNKTDSLLAEYIIAVGIKCADPNAIRDLEGNCFLDSQNLLHSIQESPSSIQYSAIIDPSISRSSQQTIGSLCLNKDASSPLGARSSHYAQKIYSYDPISKSAVKEIWNQNPEYEGNRAAVSARPQSLQNHIVGMPVSRLEAGGWIVTFSGASSGCYENKGIFAKSYYRILQVID